MSEENNAAQENIVQTIAKGPFQEYLESKNIKVEALAKNAAGTEMIMVQAADLVQITKELKKSKGLKFMTYMTSVDLVNAYQIIIQLENHESNEVLVIKTNTPKDKPSLPSLSAVFEAANWAEREAYDLMGIEFEGHPNLKRILNPDNWEGHPLRKDYLGPIDELNQPINYAS